MNKETRFSKTWMYGLVGSIGWTVINLGLIFILSNNLFFGISLIFIGLGGSYIVFFRKAYLKLVNKYNPNKLYNIAFFIDIAWIYMLITQVVRQGSFSSMSLFIKYYSWEMFTLYVGLAIACISTIVNGVILLTKHR